MALIHHYLFTKVEFLLFDRFEMHLIPNGEKQARRQVVPQRVVLRMEAFGDIPRGSKLTTPTLLRLRIRMHSMPPKRGCDQETIAENSKSLEERS